MVMQPRTGERNTDFYRRINRPHVGLLRPAPRRRRNPRPSDLQQRSDYASAPALGSLHMDFSGGYRNWHRSGEIRHDIDRAASPRNRSGVDTMIRASSQGLKCWM